MPVGNPDGAPGVLNSCRACGSSSLDLVLSLGEQALSHFVEVDSREPTPRFPLNLVACADCGLVQLRESAPKELLYGEDYGYRSGISEIIRADLQDIVESSTRFRPLREGEVVVDIGCNDGTLLSFYPDSLERAGFDPLTKFQAEVTAKGIRFIGEYFNAGTYKLHFGSRKASIVTAISMFYDLEDPNEFLEHVLEVLADDGLFVIQQNYLVSMIENNAFDNICHEHLEYYSLSTLQTLLQRHGLVVFDVEQNDINGGSIRTYIGREGRWKVNERVLQLIGAEPSMTGKEAYTRFRERCERIRETVVRLVFDEVANDRRVFALGASTRGNTLLQYFGLDASVITGAMERNPEKFGKKIASVGIPILPEDECRQIGPDYMLVLPWHLRRQIVQRERGFLESGGKLIFPLPRPSVVSRQGEAFLL